MSQQGKLKVLFAENTYTNKDAQRKVYETAALNVTRYSLFTKKQLEGEKLPPTKNAFKYHLSRAHFQLSIWSSACNSRVNYIIPGPILQVNYINTNPAINIAIEYPILP